MLCWSSWARLASTAVQTNTHVRKTSPKIQREWAAPLAAIRPLTAAASDTMVSKEKFLELAVEAVILADSAAQSLPYQLAAPLSAKHSRPSTVAQLSDASPKALSLEALTVLVADLKVRMCQTLGKGLLNLGHTSRVWLGLLPVPLFDAFLQPCYVWHASMLVLLPFQVVSHFAKTVLAQHRWPARPACSVVAACMHDTPSCNCCQQSILHAVGLC